MSAGFSEPTSPSPSRRVLVVDPSGPDRARMRDELAAAAASRAAPAVVVDPEVTPGPAPAG